MLKTIMGLARAGFAGRRQGALVSAALWFSASAAASTLDLPYTCAARPLARLSYEQYKEAFTAAAAHAAQAYALIDPAQVDAQMRLYYDNLYRPREVSCIVGKGVTLEQLQKAGVFDTAGGDVFILSPLNQAQFDAALTPPATPFQGRSGGVADNLGVVYSNEQTRKVNCYKKGELDEKCADALARRVDAQRKVFDGYLRPVGPVTTRLIRAFTYKPDPENDRAQADNAAAFARFFTAVSVNETVMTGRYEPQLSAGSKYNVFNESMSTPLDAYSASDFIGGLITAVAEDRNYEAYLRAASDFDGMAGVKAEAVKLAQAQPIAFNSTARGPALEEMIRAYICTDGRQAAMAVPALPARFQATLRVSKFYGCDRLAIGGKRVVDYAGYWTTDVDQVRDELGTLLIANRLDEINRSIVELQGIQLNQSKALLAIQNYMATDAYDKKIADMTGRVKAMEAAAEGPNFIQVVSALGTGAAGLSGMANGLDALKTLLKGAPVNSLSGMVGYFDKNADALKKSGKSISDGYSDFTAAESVIEAAIDAASGAPQAKLDALRAQLAQLRQAKEAALAAITSQVRGVDNQLIDVFAKLFTFRRVAPTLRRDVAISVDPLLALAFLGNAGAEMSGPVRACGYAIQPWSSGAESSTVNLLQSCRTGGDLLRARRACFASRPAKDTLVVVRGKTQAYVLAYATNALGCVKDPTAPAAGQ